MDQLREAGLVGKHYHYYYDYSIIIIIIISAWKPRSNKCPWDGSPLQFLVIKTSGVSDDIAKRGPLKIRYVFPIFHVNHFWGRSSLYLSPWRGCLEQLFTQGWGSVISLSGGSSRPSGKGRTNIEEKNIHRHKPHWFWPLGLSNPQIKREKRENLNKRAFEWRYGDWGAASVKLAEAMYIFKYRLWGRVTPFPSSGHSPFTSPTTVSWWYSDPLGSLSDRQNLTQA